MNEFQPESQKSAVKQAEAYLQNIQTLNCPFLEVCTVAQQVLDGSLVGVSTCQRDSSDITLSFRCHYDIMM